jgi:hypothetical protein
VRLEPWAKFSTVGMGILYGTHFVHSRAKGVSLELLAWPLAFVITCVLLKAFFATRDGLKQGIPKGEV